jgi:hypothetical protein
MMGTTGPCGQATVTGRRVQRVRALCKGILGTERHGNSKEKEKTGSLT